MGSGGRSGEGARRVRDRVYAFARGIAWLQAMVFSLLALWQMAGLHTHYASTFTVIAVVNAVMFYTWDSE